MCILVLSRILTRVAKLSIQWNLIKHPRIRLHWCISLLRPLDGSLQISVKMGFYLVYNCWQFWGSIHNWRHLLFEFRRIIRLLRRHITLKILSWSRTLLVLRVKIRLYFIFGAIIKFVCIGRIPRYLRTHMVDPFLSAHGWPRLIIGILVLGFSLAVIPSGFLNHKSLSLASTTQLFGILKRSVHVGLIRVKLADLARLPLNIELDHMFGHISDIFLAQLWTLLSDLRLCQTLPLIHHDLKSTDMLWVHELFVLTYRIQLLTRDFLGTTLAYFARINILLHPNGAGERFVMMVFFSSLQGQYNRRTFLLSVESLRACRRGPFMLIRFPLEINLILIFLASFSLIWDLILDYLVLVFGLSESIYHVLGQMRVIFHIC